MKQKEILLFGASGQIGRNLVRKLTMNNFKVTAITRNIHTKGYILKTQANPGYLNLVEIKNFNSEKIADLIDKCSICINLVGILFESKKNHFNLIHDDFPNMLSRISKKKSIEKLIHISALGIENALDSNYAKSKLEGEKRIRENFDRSVILKPSLVYSVDDNFTTNFMTLLNRLPFFPLYYNGDTKFSPIHCSDLTNIIYYVISNNIYSKIIECVGPETITFKEIIQKLLKLIEKKRILLPMPLSIANISAKIFEIMPKPLLTRDQLRLLKYNNIKSGKYKTNSDIGIPSIRYFDEEVKKYCYMWKEGGQFSTKKYREQNNL